MKSELQRQIDYHRLQKKIDEFATSEKCAAWLSEKCGVSKKTAARWRRTELPEYAKSLLLMRSGLVNVAAMVAPSGYEDELERGTGSLSTDMVIDHALIAIENGNSCLSDVVLCRIEHIKNAAIKRLVEVDWLERHLSAADCGDESARAALRAASTGCSEFTGVAIGNERPA